MTELPKAAQGTFDELLAGVEPDLAAIARRLRAIIRLTIPGGILFHYNEPYGDIYMEVAEPFHILIANLHQVVRTG